MGHHCGPSPWTSFWTRSMDSLRGPPLIFEGECLPEDQTNWRNFVNLYYQDWRLHMLNFFWIPYMGLIIVRFSLEGETIWREHEEKEGGSIHLWSFFVSSSCVKIDLYTSFWHCRRKDETWSHLHFICQFYPPPVGRLPFNALAQNGLPKHKIRENKQPSVVVWLSDCTLFD